MNKRLLAAVMILGSVPVLSHAEDKSDGCGLGWQVTKKSSFSATTTRGTTNITIPPTFGMSSGTIGCDSHTLAKKEIAPATYAVNNYEPLTADMASGKGEHLQAFARTLGCNDATFNQFGKMTQSHFESLSDTQNGMELFRKVQKELKANPTLAANCHQV